jgi:hypothetical protein
LRPHDLQQPAFRHREKRNLSKEITVKRIALLTAAFAVLVTAGAAVAHHKFSDTSQVSATLTAATPSNVQTRTYTCGDQTVEVSTGRYTGTATSTTGDLAGALELRVHSVYNTTRKLGWISGRIVVGASDDRTHARFNGILADGKLDAWMNGNAGRGDGALLGSLSGAFTTAAGLTGGQLGTGSGGNMALLVKHADCRANAKPRPSVFLTVRGQVDALSSTSISVKPSDGGASQACTIGDRKPGDRLEVGDRVEMTCVQTGSTWTLFKVRRR